MIVKIDKSFVKDTNKIVDKKLLNSIADCIDGIREINKLSEIQIVKSSEEVKMHIVFALVTTG